MVSINQRLANGQPEPQTTEVGAFTLLKGVKDSRQQFRINTAAGIFYLDAEFASRTIACPHTQFAFGWSEFHRVLNQVPKNLLKACRIGFEANMCGRKVRSKFEMF